MRKRLGKKKKKGYSTYGEVNGGGNDKSPIAAQVSVSNVSA